MPLWFGDSLQNSTCYKEIWRKNYGERMGLHKLTTNIRTVFYAATLAWLALTQPARADTGKLLLTGGVSTIDGAAGGGISPWAVIGTNATRGETGFSAFASTLNTADYGLRAYGAAVAWNNTLELSLAQQDFDATPAAKLNALGFNVAPNQHLVMNTLGVKWRVAGEAVLDADNALPQVAVGLLYKDTNAGSAKPVLDFLGAKTQGTEAYIAATKLLLQHSLLLNGVLRYTNANQGGLLGFGAAAPGTNDAAFVPEVSAAYLLSRNLAVGAEVRWMPNNQEALGRAAGLSDALAADRWQDIFVAWAPNKNVSLTAAYADLGRIVPGITANKNQSGLYLSVQFAM
jgi:hypothetical protein